MSDHTRPRGIDRRRRRASSLLSIWTPVHSWSHAKAKTRCKPRVSHTAVSVGAVVAQSVRLNQARWWSV